MRLSVLYEASALAELLKSVMGRAFFKKLQDPERHEKLGTFGHKTLPSRSGSQDTPLSPRHRRFFNAPIGGVQGKTGYGDPDDYESRRTRANTGGAPQPDVDWPSDKSELDKSIEKKARSAFGHLAAAGQRPKGAK